MLTPTQFIREAALKTGTVVTPTPWKDKPADKKVRKSEEGKIRMGDYVGVVMGDPELEDVSDEHCWLCGGESSGRGRQVKRAILDTFTDRDKARAPWSGSICPGCAFCLSYTTLRNYSILATEEGLRHPGRAEIKGLLLEPPEPPFVLCIAVSGQKWLHFRAEIAYSRDGYPVQYEETRVTVDRTTLGPLLDSVEQLYTVFTKAEILSGSYGQNRIRVFGLKRFQELEAMAALVRGSRLFDLAVFVAQKKEIEVPAPAPEKEEPCTTISTPTIQSGQLELF